jgi:hypothetical protein
MPKTISFNAALFSCVCLASRFEHDINQSTFNLISIAFILFNLWPSYRKYLQVPALCVPTIHPQSRYWAYWVPEYEDRVSLNNPVNSWAMYGTNHFSSIPFQLLYCFEELHVHSVKLITILSGCVCCLALITLELWSLMYLYIFFVIFITFVCPYILIRMQVYKK